MKMKSYDQLFQKESHESQIIDEKFAEINNSKGLTEAINYLKEIGATWLDTDNYYILYVINEYTKNTVDENTKKALFDRIANQKDIVESNICYNDKFKVPQILIKKENFEIKVMKFSEVLPKSKKLLTDLEDDRRVGTCYSKAFDIALNLGIPNDIVTGYTYGYTDKSRFLHSWIETEFKGQEVVIDGTLNAIFNKEGYYNLRHIKPLTRISDKTLREDIENYLNEFKKISPEVYFVFRDEIIRDLEKNKDVLSI